MKNRRYGSLLICILIAASSSHAIKSLEDIQVGGTYRMILFTGDDLEGIVDSKNDTSLILDCKGKPYTFVASLIQECKLLAAPVPKKPDEPAPAPASEAYSYERLLRNQPLGLQLDIRMFGGRTFRGSLVSVDSEFIKLTVDNSIIPIAKTVIDQITTVSLTQPSVPVDAPKPETPQVFDTLIVKTSETDSLGNPLGKKMLVGKIIGEDDRSISFRTNGTILSGSFPFDQVLRVFRHSQENPETDRIRRYALPLICPPGMMLVDVPPGKANRPFLKICIDKYEYPNKQGVVPKVNVSFQEAQNLCEQQGKRLCTAEEWQWACSGLEGFTYSYGWNFDKTVCNTDGRLPEAAGARYKCIGKFGAMDMTGNVFEWVKEGASTAAAMGGPLSKCQAVSAGESGGPKPQTGFRCCKSN